MTQTRTFLIVAWLALRASKAGRGDEDQASTDTTSDDSAAEKDDLYANLPVEPIEVHVGSNWSVAVGNADGIFIERVASFRKQHAQELGLILPRVRFKDVTRLGPDRYEIHIDGVIAGRGEARSDKLLAIHPTGDVKSIQGELTRDPTYGLPALWIDSAQRAAATAARYTLVDSQTVLMTHLTEVLRRESATLLTRAGTERLLARVRQTQPSLVEELIPTVLSVTDVQRVLQGLLREKVSIRHVEAILETLADAGRTQKDVTYLIERVRQRLGHAICQTLVGESNALHVLTLDAGMENQFMQSVRAAEGGQPFVLDPKLAEQFLARLVALAERMMKNNLLPVLLCSPDLRRHLRTMSERVLPHLRILSMNEIPTAIELKSYAVVTL